MELRETQLENKRVGEKKEHKGAAEYFGANLAHLLNLVQVNDTKDLPPRLGGLRRSRRKHGATRSHHSDALPVKAGSRA